MSDELGNLMLFAVTVIGMVATGFWIAFIIWTYNDLKSRTRDPLAPLAAALMVAILYVFGLVIYIMLRPQETLADAYERSLEEEALLQEIEERPSCPGCGRAVKGQWQVCPYCHTKLKKPCVSCSEVLELSWNICPYCATPQVGYDDALEAGYQNTSHLPASPYEEYPHQQAADVEWVDDSY